MRKHQSNKEAPSRVLLVCVYDTMVLNITNEIVFARFSPYGTILKILIFQRGEVTKFFLEFGDVPSAEQAKNNLDGVKLFENICKMNIYYSNFSKVDLKHDTSQGLNLEPYISPYYDAYSYQLMMMPYSCNSTEVYPFNPYATYFEPYTQDQQPFYPQQKECLNFQLQTPNKNETALSPTCQTVQIEVNISNDIQMLLRSEGKKKQAITSISQKSTIVNGIYQPEDSYQYLVFPIRYDVSNKQIYNVFSNFGNISFIKQTHQRAYIKFRTSEFAALAKNYLLNFMLLGNKLALDFVENSQNAIPHEQQFSHVTFFDSSFDRFSTAKSISINPPSTTLHISSIRKDACKPDLLRNTFEEFGQIRAIEVLSSGLDKNMALIEFQRIQDSFRAMAEMHGNSIGGRKIQISFTKSKVG